MVSVARALKLAFALGGSLNLVGVAGTWGRQKRLRHGQPTDRHRGRLLQELAAVDAPVAVFVIEIEHTLVDLALGHCLRRFMCMG